LKRQRSRKTPAYLVAHLLAKRFAARRAILFAHTVMVDHVEVFQDRRTVSALSAGSPQSFAMSTAESGRPIASPRSSRSRFSSEPVMPNLSCSYSESREQDR
jgi:hypothetical protein